MLLTTNSASSLKRAVPLTVACAVLSLGGMSCGADSSPSTTKHDYYRNAKLGLTISNFDDWAKSAEYQSDGSVEMYGEAQVDIKGMGKHTVTAFLHEDSVAQGAGQTLELTDNAIDNLRYYYFDPNNVFISVGDEIGGVMMYANPDGSYDIDTVNDFNDPPSMDQFTHAANGYEAYQTVRDFNQFSDTSPFTMVMAYAMAHGPAVAPRATNWCEEPNCGEDYSDSSGGVASEGGVCTVFQGFCQCLLCDVVGQAENCDRCPAPTAP